MTTNAAEKEVAATPKIEEGATPEEVKNDLKTSTVKGPRGEDITFKHRVSILYDYEFVSALDVIRAADEPGSKLKDAYDSAMSIILMGVTEWDYKAGGDKVVPINEEVLKKMGIHALSRFIEQITDSLEVGEGNG